MAKDTKPVTLSPKAVSAVSDAASHEHRGLHKWFHAAKLTYADGLRVGMLYKGSEKSPNPEFNESMLNIVRDAMVTGVSASQKAMRFETPNPSVPGAKSLKSNLWTVAELIALDADRLRTIDADKVLRTTRRALMQEIEGPIMARFRAHLIKLQYPDGVPSGADAPAWRAVSPEVAKSVAKVEAEKPRVRAVAWLNEIAATAMRGGDDGYGLNAAQIGTLQDAIKIALMVFKATEPTTTK